MYQLPGVGWLYVWRLNVDSFEEIKFNGLWGKMVPVHNCEIVMYAGLYDIMGMVYIDSCGIVMYDGV